MTAILDAILDSNVSQVGFLGLFVCYSTHIPGPILKKVSLLSTMSTLKRIPLGYQLKSCSHDTISIYMPM